MRNVRSRAGGNVVMNKFSRGSSGGGGGSNGKAMLSSVVQLVVFGVIAWAFYGAANGNVTSAHTVVEVNSSSYELQARDGGQLPAQFNESIQAIANSNEGAIQFKNRAGEDITWTFVDSFYFAMEIVTTVGYGDIVPASDGAKVFTIFFTLVGIIVVSGAIGTIANAFLEKQREMAKAAQRKILEQASAIGGACPQDDADDPNASAAEEPTEADKCKEDKKDDLQPADRPSKLPPLTGPLPDIKAEAEAEKPKDEPKAVAEKSPEAEAIPPPVKPPPVKPPPVKLHKESEVPVKVSKTKKFAADTKLFMMKFVVALKCAIPIYLYIAVCFVLGHMEDWSGVDSIYFSIITLTTVGFGDVTPQSQGGRLLASFLLPIGLVTLTIVASSTAEKLASVGKPKGKSLKMLLSELQHVIEEDDDGTVSEEEFMIFMLKQSGKLDEDTEDILRRQFKALDADGSGELDEDDVVMLSKLCTEMHLED